MLKWTVEELQRYRRKPLKFDTTIDLSASLHERDAKIQKATPVHVSGYVKLDQNVFIVNFKAETTLTVPSTRSLQPVDVPTVVTETEIFAPEDEDVSRFEEEDQMVMTMEDDDIVDVEKAVEDYLILSIPTQVLTPAEQNENIMPSGQGWQVISESDYNKQKADHDEQPNNAFAQLKNLFDNDSSDND